MNLHNARFGGADKAPLEFVPPLTSLCLVAAAQNFKLRPTFAGVPDKFKDRMISMLPTAPTLALEISSPLIDDESYWRRCAMQKWQNYIVSNHGHSWKQLFFERSCEEELEAFDGTLQAQEEVTRFLKLAQDYVYNLRIRQFTCHNDIAFIFDNLPNLCVLSVIYGSRNVGMEYDRSVFGMKLVDAEFMAKQLALSDSLTTLILQENLLDDEKVRRLVQGLRPNQTVTSLDLSHNRIADRGARSICKLLGDNAVLNRLVLCDNHLHSESGKFLGRMLQSNRTLQDLNVRLNRLGDKGGCYVFEGLKTNAVLRSLNLSANGLDTEAARVFGAMARGNTALTSLDLSSNALQPEGGTSVREGLEGNSTLTYLDVRLNKIPQDVEVAIRSMVKANESDARARVLATMKAERDKPH